MSVEELFLLLIAVPILYHAGWFYGSLARQFHGFVSPLLGRAGSALRRTMISDRRSVRKPLGSCGDEWMAEDAAVRIVELLGPLPGQRKSACVGAVQVILADLLQQGETVRAGAGVRNVPPCGGKDIVWLEA